METLSIDLVPQRLIPTFSPQGDGNSNALYSIPNDARKSVDPYLFPARGRKHLFIIQLNLIDEIHVDPYLFPARGRKRFGSS